VSFFLVTPFVCQFLYCCLDSFCSTFAFLPALRKTRLSPSTTTGEQATGEKSPVKLQARHTTPFFKPMTKYPWEKTVLPEYMILDMFAQSYDKAQPTKRSDDSGNSNLPCRYLAKWFLYQRRDVSGSGPLPILTWRNWTSNMSLLGPHMYHYQSKQTWPLKDMFYKVGLNQLN
jgi:hypothetical protein